MTCRAHSYRWRFSSWRGRDMVELGRIVPTIPSRHSRHLYSLTYISNEYHYMTSTHINSLFYFVSCRMEIQTCKKKGTTTSASSTQRLWIARIYVTSLQKYLRTYISTYPFSTTRPAYCFLITLCEFFLSNNYFNFI